MAILPGDVPKVGDIASKMLSCIIVFSTTKGKDRQSFSFLSTAFRDAPEGVNVTYRVVLSIGKAETTDAAKAATKK